MLAVLNIRLTTFISNILSAQYNYFGIIGGIIRYDCSPFPHFGYTVFLYAACFIRLYILENSNYLYLNILCLLR